MLPQMIALAYALVSGKALEPWVVLVLEEGTNLEELGRVGGLRGLDHIDEVLDRATGRLEGICQLVVRGVVEYSIKDLCTHVRACS